MPDLVTTVGGAASNSFASLDEADEYLDARLNAAAWNAEAVEDQKVRALIESTRELNLLPWAGGRTTATQALAWPKDDALDPDSPSVGGSYFASTVIPVRLQHATCELALEFLKAGTSDVAALDTLSNVTREKVGPIETEYALPAHRARGLARFPRVLALVRPLLDESVTSGLAVVRM